MFHIENIRISQILTVVPKVFHSLDEEIKLYNYPERRVKKLENNMGYGSHRVVQEGITALDMAYYGMRYLIDNKLLNQEDVDAIIFISVTPDHMVPANSTILHGRLGLKNNVYCYDINQACSGFITGLVNGFSILNSSTAKKVVLITGDTLSKKTSQYDKFSWLLIGDGISITVLEKGSSTIDASFYTQGNNFEYLYIPAGYARKVSTDETRQLKEVEDGNLRSEEQLFIDGLNIYNFSLEMVPKEIEKLLSKSNKSIDNIDLFCFHQPNKFIIKKIADKLNIDYNKIPFNISTAFGNISSATIPTVMAYNFAEKLTSGREFVCMAGFGAGLISATALMDMDKIEYCKIIEYENI